MADSDMAEDSQDPEAPEEELEGEYELLLHLSKHGEARRALPWKQWTFKEKANYCMDRIFLGFLAIFVVALLMECGYKIWYVSKVNKIGETVTSSVVILFNWLFTQDKHEELAEL